jgi:hypothetical protein
MSRHLTRKLVAQQATVHARLNQPPSIDRSFELPRALYAATGALYFGFLAVMAVGFATPGLIVPLGICGVFLAAFFAVPVVFAKVDKAAKPMEFERFRRAGIATSTGWLRPGEAAAQMLVLPVLIFLWAITVTAIAALV